MARPAGRGWDRDAVMVRVEVPPAVFGLTSPPCTVTLQALRVRERIVLMVAFAEGAGAEADQWLAEQGLGTVLSGLSERLARVDLTNPAPTWAAIVDEASYHHVLVPPRGPAVATLRGPRPRVQHLVERVLRASGAAPSHVRSVQVRGPASLLTERQREALVAAQKAGYYRLPRPVNLRTLARGLSISSPALSELLRRAENAIIDAYLAGAIAPVDPAMRREGPPNGRARPGRASRTPPAGPAGDRRPRRASR